MKFINYICVLFFIQFIAFTSGCNKIVEWGKENFKQTERYNDGIVKHMVPYIRSAIVYNQLETIADFTAMFLTDSARMLYVDYYINKHTITKEKEAIIRQRLLNENKYYVSFYVVCSQSEHSYPDNMSLFTGRYYKNATMLGEKDSEWEVSLHVDGKDFVPDSIRVVELPIEYQHFLGAHYSQFKSIYLVKFDALDDQDHEILTSGSHAITLKFSSARYKTELHWDDVTYTSK